VGVTVALGVGVAEGDGETLGGGLIVAVGWETAGVI
jgi:hypothetical protein